MVYIDCYTRIDNGMNHVTRRIETALAVICLLVASSILVGCDIAVLQSGTLKAVEKCISTNETALVANEVIRRQCVAKHQTRIFPRARAGEAKAWWFDRSFSSFDNFGLFSTTIRNDAENHFVLTAIRIQVETKGTKPVSASKLFPDLWIEPGRLKDLHIYKGEFPESGGFTFANLPRESYTWEVSEAYGVEIGID